MKKAILSFGLLLLSALGSSYAANRFVGVNEEILASFQHKFAGATDVSWESEKPYVKAVFSYNRQVLLAYFDTNGELIVTARNILSNELPINLLVQLKNEYPGCWISELVEMDRETDVTYYITLEDSSRKLKLKSFENYYWEIYGKEKKG
jgi:hypothetical protein